MNAVTSCAATRVNAQLPSPFAGGVERLLLVAFFSCRGTALSAGRLAAAHARLFLGLLVFGGAATAGRAQWSGQDIGAVAAAGHSSTDGNTYTVAGSGADIWGGSDAFQFFAQPLQGDGSITARVASVTDTNGWAKAGVMLRWSLDANAPNVFLAATPEWHGIVAQERPATGSNTTLSPATAAYPPYWLRLTRSGNTITADTSPDGATWTSVGSFDVLWDVTLYFGLAVTSHNDGTLCTATFDHVSITNNPPPPPPPPSTPVDFAVSTLSWYQIALSWMVVSSGQNNFQVERSADGISFAPLASVAGDEYTYTDAGLSPSTTYYYRVRASNSGGSSGYTNVASATTNAPPPPPSGTWPSVDIGTTTVGQTSGGGGAVTLTGSGADIGGTADGCRYYYQTVPAGDCELITRVGSLTDTNGLAKVGLMLRASLDPGSPEAMIWVSAEHGTAFQWRPSAGSDTQSTTPSEDGTAPRWLKLLFKTTLETQEPPHVEGYVSRDGREWTLAGRFYLSYPSNNITWQYIGLAVTSHNDGTLCTAQFGNLAFLTPPPVPAGFQVTHRGPNGEIDFAWTSGASDIDHFEIMANPEMAGNHDWRTLGIVAGSATQAIVHIGVDEEEAFRIAAFRDLVRSPETSDMIVESTVTPGLSVTGTTDSSISLRVQEPQPGLSGPQGGPWSLERSNDGTNFVVIASGLRPPSGSLETDYTDGGLPPGTTYYYRARQLLSNGDSSAYSNIANATTAPPSGGTWQSSDVGAVGTTGSDSTSGNTVTINGGGADVWGNADSFRFRYQTMVGDGSITARVVSMTDTDGWAKAGVMIRNSVDASARNVFAAVTPEWHGIVAQARSAAGDSTSLTQGPIANPPCWLRLTRAGSTFTAQTSSDGSSWTTYATYTVTMDTSVVVGLAVTSHDQTTLCTATFDNITFTPDSSPPPIWSAADIGTVGLAGSHDASGNTITVNGSGADIWDTADGFHFVWQTLSGDGVVEAQVASMTNTNGWAKAGVMIRETSEANAANIFVALTPTWHGIVAQFRGSPGATTTQIAGPAVDAPYWVRLVRTGNVITASTSPDGATWSPFASVNITMSSTALFGFAVTAHDNTQLNQSVFQDPYIGGP